MAVVTKYGDEFTKTRPPREFIDVAKQHGRVRSLHDTVEITAGDSIGSTYYLAKLPSNCRIEPGSKIYFDAIGTGATLDIGDANSVDALATDIDIAAAGSANVLEAVDIADYGKYLWELLGYEKDPGGQIDLTFTLAGAAATNSGTLTLALLYIVD